jgi:hypothetical protein
MKKKDFCETLSILIFVCFLPAGTQVLNSSPIVYRIASYVRCTALYLTGDTVITLAKKDSVFPTTWGFKIGTCLVKMI